MWNYTGPNGNGWGMMRGWNLGDGGTMMGYGGSLYSVLSIITWFLVICVLVALLRWLWKKGEK